MLILLGGAAGEQFVHALAVTLRLGVVGGRHLMLHEPAEDVADTALPGLVAPLAGGDSAVHHAAHARDLGRPEAGAPYTNACPQAPWSA